MSRKLIPKESVQYPVTIFTEIFFDDVLPDGSDISQNGVYNIVLGTLPAYAMVSSGGMSNLTAWTGATTATIDIGDDDVSGPDPDRYTATPFNLLTNSTRNTLTLPVFMTTQQCNLTAELTISGGPATAGHLVFGFEYIVLERAHEAIG